MAYQGPSISSKLNVNHCPEQEMLASSSGAGEGVSCSPSIFRLPCLQVRLKMLAPRAW